jgi:hypothetical protein
VSTQCRADAKDLRERLEGLPQVLDQLQEGFGNLKVHVGTLMWAERATKARRVCRWGS